MKLIAIVLLSFLPIIGFSKPAQPVVYDFKIISIVDGDTVKFEAKFLPPPLKPELSVRVYGVDTPEKGFRAKCPEEDKRGREATAYTKAVLSNATKLQVVLMDWDKYGGRVLGDILVDGQSLRYLLIANGYAREYFGEAKLSWCPTK
jgi:endonuclease YncB( thermonuclease family)